MVHGQSGLGTLSVDILLDDPDRIHYGAEDVVTGNVMLLYDPPDKEISAELFGPLKLDVVLQGKLMARNHHETRADIITLFNHTTTVHDGPFRAQPEIEHAIPFAISFPELADPRKSIGLTTMKYNDGTWSLGQHVKDVTVEGLPPTICSRPRKADLTSSLMGHEIGLGCHIDVKYSVSAKVEMPNIDVVISQPPNDTAVLYDLPKVPVSMATVLSQTYNIEMRMNAQDESLIPEHARPQGFKGKAKAFIKPVDPPRYIFDVGFSGVPQNIFVGQPLKFILYISGKPEISSVLAAPEITLKACTASLIARTTGREKPMTKNTANVDIVMTKEASHTPPGPFSKGSEYRKFVTFGNLAHVPSSFTHAGVTHSYTLRIAVKLAVAEQIISLKREWKVVVHSPWSDDGEPGLVNITAPTQHEPVDGEEPPPYEEAVAGPSNIHTRHPTYEEAVAGPSNIHTRQPTYEEATTGASQ